MLNKGVYSFVQAIILLYTHIILNHSRPLMMPFDAIEGRSNNDPIVATY